MQICTNGVLSNHLPVIVADHEPHSWHMPANKIRRQTETTPQSGRWQSGINNDYSTRKMRKSSSTTSSSTIWFSGHELTTWFTIYDCPHSHLSNDAIHQLCGLAAHWPCLIWNQFSMDHNSQWSSKPGGWMDSWVRLTTWSMRNP